MENWSFFWRKPVFAVMRRPVCAMLAAVCLSGCAWLGEAPHDPVYQFQSMSAACDALDYKNAFREVFREEAAPAAEEKINEVFDCLAFKTKQYKAAIHGASLNKEQLKNLLNEKFIKKDNIAPAINKITSPDYFDRFLNLKNIAISLLGQQQAAGGGIRHRQICRDSGHKNSFIRMASAEGAAWPAPLPRTDGLSKAETDVFIQFLEDSRRFFLSLEEASSLIFEELLQTDIAEDGRIPLALFLEGGGSLEGEKTGAAGRIEQRRARAAAKRGLEGEKTGAAGRIERRRARAAAKRGLEGEDSGLIEAPLEGAESEGWRRQAQLAEGGFEEGFEEGGSLEGKKTGAAGRIERRRARAAAKRGLEGEGSGQLEAPLEEAEPEGLIKMPLEGAESEGWRRRARQAGSVRLAEMPLRAVDLEGWRQAQLAKEGFEGAGEDAGADLFGSAAGGASEPESREAAEPEAAQSLDSAAAAAEGEEGSWLQRAAAAAADFASDLSESAVRRINHAFGSPEEAVEGEAGGEAPSDLSESAVERGADAPSWQSVSSGAAGRTQEIKTAVDYMEIYMLPLLEKRLAGSAPGFFQSIFLNEAGDEPGPDGLDSPRLQPFLWEAGFNPPASSGPPPSMPPEYLEKWEEMREWRMERSQVLREHSELARRSRQIRKRQDALEALGKMFLLHEPSAEDAASEGFLTRGHVKYAVFNIMLAERIFRLYDANRNSVLDEGETDSLFCFVEPLISVISSLYLEGREDGLAKDFYKWMADPQNAFYYTVQNKRTPGQDFRSFAGYGWQRLTGSLNGGASLSYDGAVRVIETLFAEFFPYGYMGHKRKEDVREESWPPLLAEDDFYP